MLALRSANGYFDAYGLMGLDALRPPWGWDFGPHLRAGHHLVFVTSHAGTVTEVEFSEPDVLGTAHVAGRPRVVGLWLDDFTVGSSIGGDLLTVLDFESYVAIDLFPAVPGFMHLRGETWAPQDGPNARRPYP